MEARAAPVEARGKADFARIDYSFDVDWDATRRRRARACAHRPASARQSPLDKLVAELMIHVNSTWGKLLADARRRRASTATQSNGKVKMSTRPGEHQGLGLTHYLWASSPLRRYSDLVNQRQLLAAIAGEQPPYADNDAELLRGARPISRRPTRSTPSSRTGWSTTGACAGSCRRASTETTAHGDPRDTLVRFDRLPLVVRLPDLPALAARHAGPRRDRARSTSSRRRSSAATPGW